MDRKKIYLIVQTLICILIVILMSACAIQIYREGSRRKAEDPLERVYTQEAVADRMDRISPLLLAAFGMTVAGLILGVKEEGKRAGAGKARRPDPASGKIQKKDDASGKIHKRDVSPGQKDALKARKENPVHGKNAVRAVLILAGIAFVVLGILNGSGRDVLMKAANICTECIGLG